MSNEADKPDKVEQPHAHFEHPTEIVADTSLSKDEKLRALEALEQDARQLSTAAAEGMEGGEDNRLDEVLDAKDALDLPPADVAFEVVMQRLKATLPGTEGAEEHRLIVNAIDALEAVSVVLHVSAGADQKSVYSV